MPSILEIARLNLGDDEVGLIEEATSLSPEISGMDQINGGRSLPGVADARPISKLNYKTKVRTSVPTGNSFRDFGAGVASAGSSFVNRLVECKVFDKLFSVDKAEADTHEDGWQAYLAEEALGIMEAGIQDWSKQFYYGTDATFGDSDGFPGLLQGYDTTLMEVDAGGTTDNVASSVWAVRWGRKDVRHVLGNNAEFMMSDVMKQYLVDAADSTKQILSYVQSLLFYPGLQIGHVHSTGRIKKLTTDSGKGLTDSLLGDLKQKFIENRKMPPDVYFASPRSIEQLRKTRTATTTTGMEAPTPTDYEGVPIVPTTGILNTETLAL